MASSGLNFSTDILLTLGQFQFCVSTAAYQHLRRVSEYRWATMERISHRPSLQYVGQGVEEVELIGVIYPHFRGSFRQLDAMRAMAQQGTPQELISGLGDDLGPWCIMAVDEIHERVTFKGVPLKQEFALRLRQFGPDQETAGAKAFVTPTSSLQLLGVGSPAAPPDLTPPDIALPTTITPLSPTIPAVAASQMLPYNDALTQAGMSPQQAAQTVTQGGNTLQNVLTAAQTILNAITSTVTTFKTVSTNFSSNPVGTIATLLNTTTQNATVAAAALTTMFGSDLSGIQNVTSAMTAANTTIPGAQASLTNDPLGTISRILTAGGALSASALNTMFGSNLGSQMGLIGSAISVTNQSLQSAGVNA